MTKTFLLILMKPGGYIGTMFPICPKILIGSVKTKNKPQNPKNSNIFFKSTFQKYKVRKILSTFLLPYYAKVCYQEMVGNSKNKGVVYVTQRVVDWCSTY